jgi:hypothetical protein
MNMRTCGIIINHHLSYSRRQQISSKELEFERTIPPLLHMLEINYDLVLEFLSEGLHWQGGTMNHCAGEVSSVEWRKAIQPDINLVKASLGLWLVF